MAFDNRAGGPTTTPYESQMGRTYVGYEETGALRVLDPARAATLGAWVARIIPGDEHWPSAGELDTVAYIDAVAVKAAVLRPLLLAGIDAATSAAKARGAATFGALSTDDQVAVLTGLETAGADSLAAQAFSVILELTYEAYYRHADVQAIVKERTGFDIDRTVQGAPLEPFPTERLTRVSMLPARYREAS
jgi:hypothetical protein